MNHNKTIVALLFTGVIATCACAKNDEPQTNSSSANLDMTNSCIKSFCGFAFGSQFKKCQGITNGAAKRFEWLDPLGRPSSWFGTNITVNLERPFRFCTQANLEYTPYEMRLCKVTIEGHIAARLTADALLEESNKMRSIVETHGHFLMKDGRTTSMRGLPTLRRRNFYDKTVRQASGGKLEPKSEFKYLPFTWGNDYCRVSIHASVGMDGTIFRIVAEDLKTEIEDDQMALAKREFLALDSEQDSDMTLMTFDLIPLEQRYLSKGQLIAKLERFQQRSEEMAQQANILEPLLPFSNAVQRAMQNDPSGYYSLALHFAKGEEVNCHYPRACLLLEQAVSNHCSNAELVYALIQIGNSDLATEEDRTWGMGTHWGMGFRQPVSDTKQKLTELFKQCTGLSCGTTFFRDIKGIDLTNESEVACIKMMLYDRGYDSGTRMNISKKIMSLLDELVAEKKRNIGKTHEKLQRERDERERREKNEELAEAVLGLSCATSNATNNMRNGSSMLRRQQIESVSGKDKEREEREELRKTLLQLREELRRKRTTP